MRPHPSRENSPPSGTLSSLGDGQNGDGTTVPNVVPSLFPKGKSRFTATELSSKLGLTEAQAEAMVGNLEALTKEEREQIVAQYEALHKTDLEFRTSLQAKGLELVLIEADGNCLFRACSQILYGSQEHHKILRDTACRFIAKRPAECGLAVGDDRVRALQAWGGDFQAYLEDLQKESVWGDDACVRAICAVYKRYAVVFVSAAGDGAVEHPEFREEDNVNKLELLLLANINGLSHFNALENARARAARLKTKPGKVEKNI